MDYRSLNKTNLLSLAQNISKSKLLSKKKHSKTNSNFNKHKQLRQIYFIQISLPPKNVHARLML